MPKTNFTKVEEVMDQGLRKMSVDSLFQATEKGKGKKLTEDEQKHRLLETLRREIKYLDPKQHKGLYTELGMKKQDIKELISNPASLTLEDWKKIKEIQLGIEKYRKEVLAQLPASTNEKLVEK